MKVKIVGHMIKEGVSTKTGTAKAYAIGEIHVLVAFSSRDPSSKGFAGGVHKPPVELIKKIVHLPLPFDAELEMQDVMLYGKQQTEVIDIRPLNIDLQVKGFPSTPAPAAAPKAAA
jgi:hypothetical protein